MKKKLRRDPKPSWLLPPTPTKSQAEEDREAFNRKYGSPERAEWVNKRPCFGQVLALNYGIQTGPCGGSIQNCHTATGGMGYKAGYETITAGCHRHHGMFDQRIAPFDHKGPRSLVRRLAVITAAAWDAR